MRCQHPGCERQGEDLELPDESPAFFCTEHMRDAGWCPGCYQFCGGQEAFEFSYALGYGGYCDECGRNPDLMGYPDEDEDLDGDEVAEMEEWYGT